MIERIRTFLAVEILVFGSAALMHFGLTFGGYEDSGAAVPESVIAAVLLAGLFASLARPALTRDAAIGVQAFALLGTLVGTTLVLTGVGPRTAVDVAYHLIMLALLIAGLVVAWRSGSNAPLRRA